MSVQQGLYHITFWVESQHTSECPTHPSPGGKIAPAPGSWLLPLAPGSCLLFLVPAPTSCLLPLPPSHLALLRYGWQLSPP